MIAAVTTLGVAGRIDAGRRQRLIGTLAEPRAMRSAAIAVTRDGQLANGCGRRLDAHSSSSRWLIEAAPRWTPCSMRQSYRRIQG